MDNEMNRSQCWA